MTSEKPDFQIIGGGLIGLATAYALLRRGASVRVIEALSGVALETSFANAGMIHASLADPWNRPGSGRHLLGSIFGLPSPIKFRLQSLPDMANWGAKFLKYAAPKYHTKATADNYRLATYSVKLTNQWRKNLEIADNFEGFGLLKIFRNPRDFEAGCNQTRVLQTLGLRAEFLSGAQAVLKEPYLSAIAPELSGAIYYPDDYKADAYKFAKALEREIIKLGADMVLSTPVNSIIEDNGRVIGVLCAKRDYLADTTIITAGARSTGLLQSLNIKLPVRPIKGYSLTFPNHNERGGPKLPVVDDGLHCAITPLGDGLRIAGTAEITGFNTRMSPKDIAPLLGMLQQVYPDLAKNLNAGDGKAWHGFRPVSADGIPFIGQIKPGLAVNTGHGHMGWTMAAGAGELLSDLMLEETGPIDAIPYDPNRS